MSTEKLAVMPLTQAAFAPYGDVIESEGRDSYFINNGMAERFHALARVETGGDEAYAVISLVKSKKFELPSKVDHVEHHPLGSQAFLPVDQTPCYDGTTALRACPVRTCFPTRRASRSRHASAGNYHPAVSIV